MKASGAIKSTCASASASAPLSAERSPKRELGASTSPAAARNKVASRTNAALRNTRNQPSSTIVTVGPSSGTMARRAMRSTRSSAARRSMSSELSPCTTNRVRRPAPANRRDMEVNPHGLFDLGESEVDALPFGLISVDFSGNIEQYNSYESKLARLSKERVIGRNFFRDVAPCAAVQEFQRRFERFAQESGDGAESFYFTFQFPFGRQFVNITFLRSAKNKQIKILVNRYDEQ